MSIKALLEAARELPVDHVSTRAPKAIEKKALTETVCRAEDLRIAAVEGLKGLGAITAIAADHTDVGVSPHDINRIGCLMVEIAELLDIASEYGAFGCEPVHR